MICRDLTTWEGTRIVATTVATRRCTPYRRATKDSSFEIWFTPSTITPTPHPTHKHPTPPTPTPTPTHPPPPATHHHQPPTHHHDHHHPQSPHPPHSPPTTTPTLPYTLTLQYPSYSKYSQLSYEPGCSHELWCRKCATWLWNDYVLIFSWTLFYTISQDILLLRAQNAIKQCKWYISRKPLCQGLRICKTSKSVVMQGRTAASYIAHDL